MTATWPWVILIGGQLLNAAASWAQVRRGRQRWQDVAHLLAEVITVVAAVALVATVSGSGGRLIGLGFGIAGLLGLVGAVLALARHPPARTDSDHTDAVPPR